jgi:uncharacterized protein (DUF427 family)
MFARRPTPDPVGPGQESVWAYPRPPALVASTDEIVVTLGGQVIARTRESYRVLETSHPPSYYLPREAFVDGALTPGQGSSFCEWKGRAAYLDLHGGGVTVPSAAWTYPAPSPRFDAIAHFVSLYPGRVDSVTVDGEVVRPQEGGFYGGWITDRVVGPFKGSPGSNGW